jgi:integrase
MPARQRGWARKRKNGWQACWRAGDKQRVGPKLFRTKTEAEDWLDAQLEAGHALRGFEVTFAAHVDRYLRVHSAVVQPATIRSLRERLGVTRNPGRVETSARSKRRSYQTALEAFGDLTLAELEAMAPEIAEWQATLPPAYRYAIVRALRQVLGAAVKWKLVRENPACEAGPNPQPLREEVAFFASLADVDTLAVELGHAGPVKHRATVAYGPVAVFAVETGLRPSEWIALERRDIDRTNKLVRVRRSVVDGESKEYGKTSRSRGDVPLTARALAAIDGSLPRLDTPLLFPSREGGHIGLDNFRRREWRPALEAAGLPESLSPYAMRHTYASFALDAGVSIFELARLMGTSVKVVDATYGHLVRDSFERVRISLEARARRDLTRTERARRRE